MLILPQEREVFAFSSRGNGYFARIKRPFFSLLLSYNQNWLLAKNSSGNLIVTTKSETTLFHSFLSFYKVRTAIKAYLLVL